MTLIILSCFGGVLAQEIERKFLVQGLTQDFLSILNSISIRQFYISLEPVVRVRITDQGSFLTLKGKGVISKAEFEYSIPTPDAEQMANLRKGSDVIKKRYLYDYRNHLWEIDVFEGENAGLVVAEIELEHDDEEFEMPSFIATEVTATPGYSNANLSLRPFSRWNISL